ncbi:MAG: RDD family protein [Usitatibacter sp.]
MSTSAGLYVGATRRLAAALVDGVILFALLFIVFSLMSSIGIIALELGIREYPALVVAYFVLLPASRKQATLGQSALEMKITTLAGERIGIARSALRFAASLLTLATAMLGLFMAEFDPKRRALHDRIAGTLVVTEKATPEEVRAGGTPMRAGATAKWVIGIGVALPALLFALALPTYFDMRKRTEVQVALHRLEPIKKEVESALLEDRVPPAGPRILPPPNNAVTVLPQGRILLRFPQRYGWGTVTYTPTRTGSVVVWKCSTNELARSWLPPACRD